MVSSLMPCCAVRVHVTHAQCPSALQTVMTMVEVTNSPISMMLR
ncbi:hypothetical protein PPTG_22282 [Phytophthora nicotianae INRA-310]|uniref:Uncharacterized protein n=1 Tax=Phytophthora nicotianae (strain INRA-310) TaxID=761204 RepID=W2QLF1_PHYN3|nr:hypothetical protein PPTG_22282 [Phytophthora nicotianae INRA-310]ETN13973.1 hypothetical protein PPTG_22282 [Phytophthora nicotianae INRA-310]